MCVCVNVVQIHRLHSIGHFASSCQVFPCHIKLPILFPSRLTQIYFSRYVFPRAFHRAKGDRQRLGNSQILYFNFINVRIDWLYVNTLGVCSSKLRIKIKDARVSFEKFIFIYGRR